MDQPVNMKWFSKYQYTIGGRTVFSNTRYNNCQSSKAAMETWFNLIFEKKMFLFLAC